MMRWKTAVILLLCALVIIAGALLPKLVGSLMDRYETGRVEQAGISQIHLEFDNSGMTMREKLALLSSSTSAMQVSTDMTVQTSAQVWQIAMKTVENYRQAGLIPTDLSAANISYCVPTMVYWEKQGGTSEIHSNIFWELSIADGAGGDNALTMTIDDRSGIVCTLSYQNVMTHREDHSRLDKALETLCSLALVDLGEEFSDVDPQALVDAAGIQGTASSYAAADIAWQDTIHGEIRLAFVVSEVGFYTYTY